MTAHLVATTRDTFNRQRTNAALSDYATAEVRLLEAGAR